MRATVGDVQLLCTRCIFVIFVGLARFDYRFELLRQLAIDVFLLRYARRGDYGVTVGGQNGLVVDGTDLTVRVLDGIKPAGYAVNATVPRSVARLVMRHYANTCGDMALSVPIRSICLDDGARPWQLYDFLLHFSLVYDLPKWSQARLLEDTFESEYGLEDIQKVLDTFFDAYRRPGPCDGPAVFSLDVQPSAANP